MKFNIYVVLIILVLLVSLIIYNTEGFSAGGMAAVANGVSGSSSGFDPSIILIIVGSTFGVVILAGIFRYVFTKPSINNNNNYN